MYGYMNTIDINNKKNSSTLARSRIKKGSTYLFFFSLIYLHTHTQNVCGYLAASKNSRMRPCGLELYVCRPMPYTDDHTKISWSARFQRSCCKLNIKKRKK